MCSKTRRGYPARVLSNSYSIGVSMPRPEWRRRRLWKISMCSKIAFASSTCMRDQNASIIALSSQSPTDPIDGTSPDCLARSVNAQEVNWVP